MGGTILYVSSRRRCIGSSVDSQQVNLEQVGACSVFDSVGCRWTADHAQDANPVEDSSISSSLHSHTSGGFLACALLYRHSTDIYIYDIYMQGFVVLTSLVLYFSSFTSLLLFPCAISSEFVSRSFPGFLRSYFCFHSTVLSLAIILFGSFSVSVLFGHASEHFLSVTVTAYAFRHFNLH
jgi:hypothetical protein